MKKINMKLAALGLAVIMGAATLVGCGGSAPAAAPAGDAPAAEAPAADAGSGDQVTIKFVHKYSEANRATFIENQVKAFEEANPNIKVEIQAYGDEEIKDKIRVLLGSADSPDVYFTWAGERLNNYVKTDNAMDISSYYEADSEWKDNFAPAQLEACEKNGSLYAVPWNYSCKAMVYNKAVFEEAGVTDVPKTWSELLDVCEKVKATGKTPIAIGNQYSWVVCHYLTALNGVFVDPETLNSNYTMETVEYTDPGYAQALDLIKDLYDKGYVNEDVNSMPWETSQAMVQEGTAAMIYEEVQDFVNYEEKIPEGWDWFELPEVEGTSGVNGNIIGGPDCFVVNTATQHPDECIALLKWLTTDESQAEMLYELGFLPVVDCDLDDSKVMEQSKRIIELNVSKAGLSYWLDCAIDQTVSDTYLEGCQTIFAEDDGASVMAKVNETAKEVAEDL